MVMTLYEIIYFLGRFGMPYLQKKVYKDLRRIAKDMPSNAKLLDIGGRKSPYTIGLPVTVTIFDRFRKDKVQEQYGLGLTSEISRNIKNKRSNIEDVVLGENLSLQHFKNKFDIVIAIEVLEHVEEDKDFLATAYKLLKPGGVFYMTTPNGDYIKLTKDFAHVRHYKRKELLFLLNVFFQDVVCRYDVKTGKFRYKGLRSFSWYRPWQLAEIIVCNIFSSWESKIYGNNPKHTAHLIAFGRKAFQTKK